MEEKIDLSLVEMLLRTPEENIPKALEEDILQRLEPASRVAYYMAKLFPINNNIVIP